MGCDDKRGICIANVSTFQSTHPGGVRRYNAGANPPAIYFNPRTRVGCDDLQPGERYRFSDFNPRTRVGCDAIGYQVFLMIYGFQSTHPGGVRPVWLDAGPRPTNFNPRTRVGCDLSLVIIVEPLLHISIHAPGWGATRGGGGCSPPPPNFNPRTRVGCD